MTARRLVAEPLPGVPEIEAGDDLAGLLAGAAARVGGLRAGDVLVVAHKAVAKAEGRVVPLAGVEPGARALALAAEHGKDARLVELILRESAELVRADAGRLIARTRHGFVCANAGVDQSNAGGEERAVLLPEDPDASARALRARLGCAVVVGDSFGRAWRVGQAEVAIGCAGLAPLEDWRGRPDGAGRILRESVELVRADAGRFIARTRHGFVCANAGVDQSNAGGEERAVLLPEDPDASARALRARLGCAVVIGDSFGRAWRVGQAEVAIGCAGLAPLEDWRGRPDRAGRLLRATQIAIADQAAAAADLVRGKDTAEPAVRIRGLERHVLPDDGPGAAALLRAAGEDLFG